MFESEVPNPTSQPQAGTTGDAMPPDPVLSSGSFIDPQRTDSGPEESPEHQQTENGAFAPGSVIEAQPITVVAPGESTPRKKRGFKSDPEEMAKRPSWLPEDWKMDVKVRTSGSTAGLIDRYYYEPGKGSRFRSKNEVMTFLETGSKSIGKKSKSKTDAATSESPSNQKQNKRKSNSKTEAGTSESPASQKQSKRKSDSKTEAGTSGSPVSQKQKKSSAKRKKSEAA